MIDLDPAWLIDAIAQGVDELLHHGTAIIDTVRGRAVFRLDSSGHGLESGMGSRTRLRPKSPARPLADQLRSAVQAGIVNQLNLY
ncbi:MAG: hypothetical protein OWR62_10930 [Sulfobacillus thermotolerans]|nr:hypothetical protein [Sulfobacillus thermotolerans]